MPFPMAYVGRHPKPKDLLGKVLYGIGSVLRGTGKALDSVGSSIQGPFGVQAERESGQIAWGWHVWGSSWPCNVGGLLVVSFERFRLTPCLRRCPAVAASLFSGALPHWRVTALHGCNALQRDPPAAGWPLVCASSVCISFCRATGGACVWRPSEPSTPLLQPRRFSQCRPTLRGCR
jgi:hypothetical protein